MQIQPTTDVSTLFAPFIKSTTTASNPNKPLIYTPIEQEKGKKMSPSLKLLGITGAAGIALYGVYKSGKNSGLAKIEEVREEFLSIIKKQGSTESEAILGQIKKIATKSSELEGLIKKLQGTMDKLTSSNNASQKAIMEAITNALKEINGKNAISQKAILDAISTASKQPIKLDQTSIDKIGEILSGQLSKFELSEKARGEAITRLIKELQNELKNKSNLKLEDIEATISKALGGLGKESKGKIDSAIIAKLVADCTSSVVAENQKTYTAILQALSKHFDDINSLSQSSYSKIENAIVDAISLLDVKGEISEAQLEKIITSIQKEISKIGEISEAQLGKIITSIQEEISKIGINGETSAPAKIVEKAQTIAEKTIAKAKAKENGLSSFLFKKGVAYQADGKLFSGTIEDTLKTGEKIVFEIKDGHIVKCAKFTKDGAQLFEKIYDDIMTIKKGNLITKKVVTTKKDGFERIYRAFTDSSDGKLDSQVLLRNFKDNTKKEISRFGIDKEKFQLLKVKPDGYLYKKVRFFGKAQDEITSAPFEYKLVGVDSQGFETYQIGTIKPSA